MEDFEINSASSGASEKTSVSANKMRIGGYALLEGRPCKIAAIEKCKPGKHGHAKVSFAGSDVFNGSRHEAHMPASHEIEVPNIAREDYLIIKVEDDYTQLLSLSGTLREDVSLPKGKIGDEIAKLRGDTDEVIVTVISYAGESAIIDARKKEY